jgi:hypothetical protein
MHTITDPLYRCWGAGGHSEPWESACSLQDMLIHHLTPKSFRIAAERENGGPIQYWPDLLDLDEPILASKAEGPPCEPRIKP